MELFTKIGFCASFQPVLLLLVASFKNKQCSAYFAQAGRQIRYFAQGGSTKRVLSAPHGPPFSTAPSPWSPSGVKSRRDLANGVVNLASHEKVTTAVNSKAWWAVEARYRALPIFRPPISTTSKRGHEPLLSGLANEVIPTVSHVCCPKRLAECRCRALPIGELVRAPGHVHSAHAALCCWSKPAARSQLAQRTGLMAPAWRPTLCIWRAILDLTGLRVKRWRISGRKECIIREVRLWESGVEWTTAS